MEFLEKYKIKAGKRTLLALAGLVWSAAGLRVLTLGFGDLTSNADQPWGFILASGLVFAVFSRFVFGNMVRKHTDRILSSPLTKHCIFSFFDFKGYGVMLFMMGGGIALRSAHLVDPAILGSFYFGLGSALLLAGIRFLLLVVKLNSRAGCKEEAADGTGI